jgi:YegS/Rv2252/BmrU family lipid kinase
MRSSLVIINPISGPARHRSAEACAGLARDVFTRRGLPVDVRVTAAPGDARRFSEQARGDAAPLVVAWGGDGTINEVAGGIAFSDAALGIVPGGSGNGLARDLGIPLDAAAALDIVVAGRTRRIDAGQLGSALFFNVAGIGLDALIARHIARPDARRGLSGYARVTLVELPRYRPERYEIVCNDRTRERRAIFIALANSRQYGNNALIAPTARLDDGQLNLVIVEAQPLRRIVASIPDLFKGRLAPRPGLEMEEITSATIRAASPIAFHVDGEPGIAGSSVTASIRPGALLVRAP